MPAFGIFRQPVLCKVQLVGPVYQFDDAIEARSYVVAYIDSDVALAEERFNAFGGVVLIDLALLKYLVLSQARKIWIRFSGQKRVVQHIRDKVDALDLELGIEMPRLL